MTETRTEKAQREETNMQAEQERAPYFQWDGYQVCDVCGRDNSEDENEWLQDNICPNCAAEGWSLLPDHLLAAAQIRYRRGQ